MAPLTIQRYVQVARRPAFRRFWLGMMISRAGDAFTTVALSWVVLDIAGPLQLGVVLLCFGLPRVVSGPVAGHVLDRAGRPDPRLLLAADNAVRGMLIAVVPVLLWLHHLVVADLYGIAVASALCSAVTEVAEAALVPRMVDDEHLEGANSLLAANWELAAIAGPVVSGVIVAAVGAPCSAWSRGRCCSASCRRAGGSAARSPPAPRCSRCSGGRRTCPSRPSCSAWPPSAGGRTSPSTAP
jgi:MFS family permease